MTVLLIVRLYLMNSILHFGLNDNGSLNIIFIKKKGEIVSVFCQQIHTGWDRFVHFVFYLYFLGKHITHYINKKMEILVPMVEKNHINSVHHIEIESKKLVISCRKYFPNAYELNLSYKSVKTVKTFLLFNLSHIIHLKQLTKLTINHYYGCCSKIIQLLNCTSHVNTLKIEYIWYRFIITSTKWNFSINIK